MCVLGVCWVHVLGVCQGSLGRGGARESLSLWALLARGAGRQRHRVGGFGPKPSTKWAGGPAGGAGTTTGEYGAAWLQLGAVSPARDARRPPALPPLRRQGPNAMPHLTLTHYTELLEAKGIVLVRGDIIHPQLVSRFEVGCRQGVALRGAAPCPCSSGACLRVPLDSLRVERK